MCELTTCEGWSARAERAWAEGVREADGMTSKVARWWIGEWHWSEVPSLRLLCWRLLDHDWRDVAVACALVVGGFVVVFRVRIGVFCYSVVLCPASVDELYGVVAMVKK